MHLIRTSVLVAPLVIVCLFATALVGIDRLAFRDVSHFYTPLYDYVSFRQQSEWLPWWNPHDQTGIPLVGETTTAVFYPPRVLLFSLPISSETALAWYVVLHLILAAFSARTLARWNGAARWTADVAAVVYPLSGAVLFLCANPPFLVGAAWLPLVLGALIDAPRMSVSRRVMIAGPALAMMVTGGDPQTALHAMMVASAVVVTRCLTRKTATRATLVVPLLVTPLVAAALAAPQVAASVSWARQSDRVRPEPHDDWLQAPSTGSRRMESFQFSLPPWHVAEVLTPNAFGSLFPENRRLSRLIPGDGRMWTPTIYLGMLTAIALIARVGSLWSLGRDRRDPKRWRADTWLVIAVLGLLLSLGHFGAMWVFQNFTDSWAEKDSAIGGPYWFLYQFVPGYDAFRYPTKWLPFFSLAATIITTQWIDRTVNSKRDTVAKAMLPGLIGLLIASLAIWALRHSPEWLTAEGPNHSADDSFWGPLEINGGLWQTQLSLIHSLVVLAAITLALRQRSKGAVSRRKVALGLLLVVAVDMTWAGRELIARVNRADEQALMAELTERQPEPPMAGRWMRTRSGGGWPTTWSQTSDRKRIVDVEASERHAWFGRWHLAGRQSVLNNMTSIQSDSIALFWDAAGDVGASMTAQQNDQFWHAVRHWLAIDGVIHSSSQSVSVQIQDRTASLIDVRRRTRDVSPMRFHDRWKRIADNTPEEMATLLAEVLETGGDNVPAIHPGKTPVPIASAVPDEKATFSPSVTDTNRLELRAGVPGLVTRPVMQDGNWVAEYRSLEGQAETGSGQWRSLTVHRVDFLKQGVFLPAGAWDIRFRYAPAWAIPTICLAAISWAVVLVTMLGSRRGRSAKRRTSPSQAAIVSSSDRPEH